MLDGVGDGHGGDREGHPLQGDGALRGDVPGQRGVEADAQRGPLAVLGHREDRADAVDVTLDEVPVEVVGGAQAALEVDAVARAARSEAGHPQGLAHEVGAEAAVSGLRAVEGREAHAVDGERAAGGQPVEGASGVEGQGCGVRLRVLLEGDDGAKVGDDPSEHVSPSWWGPDG